MTAGKRKCSKCKIEKPLTKEYFSLNSTSRSAPSNLFKYCCRVCYPKTDYIKDKEHKMKRVYGIDMDGYQAMLLQQEEKCAICKKLSYPLVIDHNHNTGKTRNLLCGSCNKLCGFAKESTDILIRAIHYLNLHNKGYE